ncbi:MAG: hypothetical protein EAZ37_08235 [Burkholderiales bacterium]|nr:MAG: hypothetical protein EAZ37_08235 [Burkholderiales bacterium]
MLLVDNEAYITTIHTSPGILGSGCNVTAAACGATPVTSCTASTNASYGVYLYADDRHLAPTAHRLMGDNAYNKIKARW